MASREVEYNLALEELQLRGENAALRSEDDSELRLKHAEAQESRLQVRLVKIMSEQDEIQTLTLTLTLTLSLTLTLIGSCLRRMRYRGGRRRRRGS